MLWTKKSTQKPLKGTVRRIQIERGKCMQRRSVINKWRNYRESPTIETSSQKWAVFRREPGRFQTTPHGGWGPCGVPKWGGTSFRTCSFKCARCVPTQPPDEDNEASGGQLWRWRGFGFRGCGPRGGRRVLEGSGQGVDVGCVFFGCYRCWEMKISSAAKGRERNFKQFGSIVFFRFGSFELIMKWMR